MLWVHLFLEQLLFEKKIVRTSAVRKNVNVYRKMLIEQMVLEQMVLEQILLEWTALEQILSE